MWIFRSTQISMAKFDFLPSLGTFHKRDVPSSASTRLERSIKRDRQALLPTAACDDSPDRTLPTKPVTERTPGKLARPRVPFSRPPSRPRAFVRQPPRGPTPASKHAPRLLPSPPGTKVATATAAPKYRTPKAPLPHLLEPSSHGPAPLHACRLRSRRPWPRRGRLVLPSPPPRPLSRRRRPCRRFLGRLAGERRAATADESAAAGAAAAARDAILPRVGARPPPRQGEPPQL